MAETLFYILAAGAVAGGVGVVAARMPLFSLLSLLGTFFCLAGIYLLAGFQFLAAAQLLVYAGAIMVLFLFVIMLLNLGHDYQRDIRGGIALIFGFAVAGSLGGLLARQLGSGAGGLESGLGTADAIDAALLEYGAVGAIARPLFTDYVVAFELTGILLLVAIVGAIVLARKGV